MRIKSIVILFCISLILITGCGKEVSNEQPEEVEVLIGVQRTGNVLTNMGTLDVLIDDEEIFTVDGDSTRQVELVMLEGEHTIQAKGQGDKSKKLKFEVNKEGENEFYYTAKIGNLAGVKLKEKK